MLTVETKMNVVTSCVCLHLVTWVHVRNQINSQREKIKGKCVSPGIAFKSIKLVWFLVVYLAGTHSVNLVTCNSRAATPAIPVWFFAILSKSRILSYIFSFSSHQILLYRIGLELFYLSHDNHQSKGITSGGEAPFVAKVYVLKVNLRRDDDERCGKTHFINGQEEDEANRIKEVN